MSDIPENLWPADAEGQRYPDAHYDDDDTCPCPDHVRMRAEWADTAATIGERIFRQLFER